MVTVDFTNKTALVTGSSKGVGAATARILAKAGARVCVHYKGDLAGAKEVLEAVLCSKGDRKGSPLLPYF